jgi:hypothetical protein
MKMIRRIKQSFGSRMLRSEAEPARQRMGFNFNSAERIGILYSDVDEPHFNKVRSYAKFLKDEFGIKSVRALGFIDEINKRLPVWQSQKLEFEYFTRDDINWHFKPVQNVETFIQDDFDILIDLSSGNDVPLNFVLKESKAHMKVGRKGSKAERYCDFIMNMGDDTGMEKFIVQLNTYLSNPKIK